MQIVLPPGGTTNNIPELKKEIQTPDNKTETQLKKSDKQRKLFTLQIVSIRV